MPLPIATGAPTLVIRRAAYERANFVRAAIDERLGLTPEEFRVEGDIVAIGPVHGADVLAAFLRELEAAGLDYYDDFFELTGNWPDWLSVFGAAGGDTGRKSPSQPQR
jgi:hypothetical protein